MKRMVMTAVMALACLSAEGAEAAFARSGGGAGEAAIAGSRRGAGQSGSTSLASTIDPGRAGERG